MHRTKLRPGCWTSPANEKKGISNPGKKKKRKEKKRKEKKHGKGAEKANIMRRLAPLNNEDRDVGVSTVYSLSVVYYYTEYMARLSVVG